MELKDFDLTPSSYETLSHACDAHRLPHTIVIEGGNSDSRLQLAYFIAAAHQCLSEGSRPCGECKSCRKISSRNHPDVMLLEATNKDKKPLSADNIRKNVIKKVPLLPSEGRRNVFILHRIDLPAVGSRIVVQNILLKVLEEPPEPTVFILTCADKSSLLSTVLSRAVIFSLGEILDTEDDPRYPEAVKAAKEIADAIAEGNEFSLLCATAALQKDNAAVKITCNELSKIFRDALVRKHLLQGDLMSQAPLESQKLSTRITEKQLLLLIETADSFSNRIIFNPNNALLITNMSAEFMKAVNR